MEDIYIVATIGLGSPLNLPKFSAGITKQLSRFPRFQRIQVARTIETFVRHQVCL
jgi:hypothetical protein